jgi:hypothetical protein
VRVCGVVVCVFLLAASSAGSGQAAKPRGARCGGRPAKVQKQPSQVWSGSDANDAFVALGGDDYLIGAGGDDSLCGGGGADAVFGGKGNDFVNGGAGDNLLFGGAGDDVIRGGPGNDFISGGTGRDRCIGGGGNDVIRECESVDRGPASKDSDPGSQPPAPPTTTTVNIAVNDAKRLVHVWGTTVPHAGADTVYVVIQHKTPANEWARVDGGCFGFGPDNRFEHTFALAPANNYRVQARYGDPACPAVQYAPSSADWQYFDVKAAAAARAATRDFGPSFCGAAAAAIRGTVFEGGPGDDALAGTGDADYLLGAGGNDTLCGGGGPDVLSGGDGADHLDGQGGDDSLFGGAGDDILRASPDPPFPGGCKGRCLPNSNTLYGGDGNDTLYGSRGPDVLIGGPGTDVCHLGGHPKGSHDKHPGCETVLP